MGAICGRELAINERDRAYVDALDLTRPPQASVQELIIEPASRIKQQPLRRYDPAQDRLLAPDPCRQITLPKMSLIRLRNAYLSGEGLVIAQNGALLAESNLRPPHVEATKNGRALLARAPNVRKCGSHGTRPLVALNGVWPIHYGHWLYDNFARLGALDRVTNDIASLDFSVGYGERAKGWLRPKSFQWRSLVRAGIDPNRIRQLNTCDWIHVPDLIFLSPINNFRPPARDIYTRPEAFAYLRGLAPSHRALATKKKIWCSRRDTKNRRLENEARIERHLEKCHGFEIISLGTLTFDEQIAAFANADVVAGPIGNAFMNMPFAGPNTKFRVMLPREAAHFLPYYQSFAHAGDCDVAYMFGDTTRHASRQKLNELRWQLPVEAAYQFIANGGGDAP